MRNNMDNKTDNKSNPKKQKGENMLKKVFGEILQWVIRGAFIVLAIAILIKGGGWAFGEAYDLLAKTPSSNQEVRNVELVIPKGATTETIAGILEENGLIGSSLFFRMKSKLDGNDGKFQYGDYTLSTAMSEEDIMKILMTEGAKRETKTFTIVEGLTLAKTAESLEAQGICTRQEFFKALDNTNWGYKFLESVPDTSVRNIRYQGYLFPSTYEIYADATAVDVISTMFDHLDKIWTDEYYARAEALGLTVDQVITIASIIEKEVVEPSEQVIVSGIIHNRLEIDMKLQMCSSVLYVLDKHRSRLLYSDLETPSPYNTYIHPGLPIGPIANPGAGAIYAALYPDDNDYLYFVLKDDGSSTHEFNSDYNDHINDKSKYTNTFNY